MKNTLMRQYRTYQTQNCVEFREGGVDEGVGDNVVALGDAYDTVGANLTLTNTGNKDTDTCGKADAEADLSAESAAGVFTHHNKESHKAVDTLGRGKSGKQQVASGRLRFAFKSTLCRVTRDCGADGRANAGKGEHQAKSKIS